MRPIEMKERCFDKPRNTRITQIARAVAGIKIRFEPLPSLGIVLALWVASKFRQHCGWQSIIKPESNRLGRAGLVEVR